MTQGASRERRPVMLDVEEAGMRRGRRADSCAIVIFGASGDLARRELFPSLFELYMKGFLPAAFAVIGVAREQLDDDQFRQRMRENVMKAVTCDEGDWNEFASRIGYVQADVVAAAEEGYAAVSERFEQVRAELALDDNVLFHLAVPPSLFSTIASGLGSSGLATPRSGWRRLVVEKPFGTNRESARELDVQLRQVFDEEQIYRVDHFLGKETVQNMLVFRFANPAYEPVWNRNYIDHVQITVAEDIGIGTRANFYEQTGVVRDMLQNHLLQLLCMTAMEPPVRFDAASLRDETVKVLAAVRPIAAGIDSGAVRGQYGAGSVGGEPVAGYRDEKGVPDDSLTSTYAAVRLMLDNWRWAGVPFYLRTGKRMTRKLTEVAIHFKPTPYVMFPPEDGRAVHQSVLVFELQPDEGIVQALGAKQPGPDLAVRTVTMRFDYAEAFGVEEPPSAYAWLLLDAMQGDQTLFARSDWVDRAWQIVDPIVERWSKEGPSDFPNYEAGSAGPQAADRLLARDGRKWRKLEAGELA